LLTLDDRSGLVGAKLRGPEPRSVLIVEATAVVARFFQLAIESIPADVLDSGYSRLVQAFDAESRNLIKGGAAVLEPIVRRPGIGPERFLACLASVSVIDMTRNENGSRPSRIQSGYHARKRAISLKTEHNRVFGPYGLQITMNDPFSCAASSASAISCAVFNPSATEGSQPHRRRLGSHFDMVRADVISLRICFCPFPDCAYCRLRNYLFTVSCQTKTATTSNKDIFSICGITVFISLDPLLPCNFVEFVF